jgi:Uncharacterized protein conserved in bacteria (DUF2066)
MFKKYLSAISSGELWSSGSCRLRTPSCSFLRAPGAPLQRHPSVKLLRAGIAKYLSTLVLLFFPWYSGLAATVSPYQAEVPIASHSAEDWTRTLPSALKQVLVKVSGNSKVMDIEVVKHALLKPDVFVQSYNYAPAETGGNGLILQVRFSPKAINNLLNQDVNVAAAPPVSVQPFAVLDPDYFFVPKETIVAVPEEVMP